MIAYIEGLAWRDKDGRHNLLTVTYLSGAQRYYNQADIDAGRLPATVETFLGTAKPKKYNSIIHGAVTTLYTPQ